MTTSHLEDLRAQLLAAVGSGRDTRLIVSAIGEALAEAREFADEFPELIDWEMDVEALPVLLPAHEVAE